MEAPELSSATQPPSAARSLLVVFQVILVAVAGSFLVQATFGLFGIGSSEILSETWLLFVFMVSEASVVLFLIALFLRSENGGFRRLGWKWADSGREAVLGVAFVPILFASTIVVNIFFQLVFPEYISTTNPLLDLVRDYRDLVLFLISSIFVGGLKEEIQRAFVLDRFERYVGILIVKVGLLLTLRPRPLNLEAARWLGLATGLVLWSLFFAVGHAVQGIDNAVGAGVLGLLFGLLYIWRGNLVAPIVAHALYDITTLLAFWNFLKA